MKNIKIYFGDEFKAFEYEITEGDIFEEQYRLAKIYLDDIVKANRPLNKKYTPNCVNNIIAFDGERGQGKTTAMQTFVRNITNNNYLKLEVIDPSTFESMHNVVEVVVTKMYNRISQQNEKREQNKELYFKILDQFQTVYESISLVRNPKKFDDLEQDYEGTIEKISRAGDSARLREHMWELVNSYVKFEGSNYEFLIVPVDDLDVNITLAYKMAEQIRKYLVIPNIIIVMAVKVDQLKYCVELQFRKEMKELLDANVRINVQEPSHMASKYIDKLIPDGRKIGLPEIRLLANENEHIQIEYIRDRKNILEKYNNCGIETTLLSYIYEKTGLHFVKKLGQIHPIIPNTLRELVNLCAVIGKMEHERKNMNLSIFESYFLNTWAPNNLDDQYVRVLRTIHNTPSLAINKVLCPVLLDMLENYNLYTLDWRYSETPRQSMERIKMFFREKNLENISLGDMVALIDFFENYFTDSMPKIFAFALKTIYSITMCTLSIQTSKKVLYSFVGGSIWGHKILLKDNFYYFEKEPKVEACIRKEGKSGTSRTFFTFSSRDFLNISSDQINADYLSQEVLKEIDGYDLCGMLFFSDFNSEFIKGNWKIDTKPIFNLENLFLSAVYPECILEKVGKKVDLNYKEFIKDFNCDVLTEIVSNIELSQHVYASISNDKNYHDKSEGDIWYTQKLFNSIHEAINSEQLTFTNERRYFILVDWNKILRLYYKMWNCRFGNIEQGYLPDEEISDIKKLDQFKNFVSAQKLGRVCVVSTLRWRAEQIVSKITQSLISNSIDLDAILDIVEYCKGFKTNDKISIEMKNEFNKACDYVVNQINNFIELKG